MFLEILIYIMNLTGILFETQKNMDLNWEMNVIFTKKVVYCASWYKNQDLKNVCTSPYSLLSHKLMNAVLKLKSRSQNGRFGPRFRVRSVERACKSINLRIQVEINNGRK